MSEKQTDNEAQLPARTEDADFTIDPNALDTRGDLLGIASADSLTKAAFPANMDAQYSMVPPAIWGQIDLLLAMGQAATAAQLQTLVSHLVGHTVPQAFIKYHVFKHRERLLKLRDEFLKESYASLEQELYDIARNPKSMRYQKAAMVLGAMGEGMISQVMEGKMTISPNKFRTMVAAFDQLRNSDRGANGKDKGPAAARTPSIDAVEAVVDKISKGKGGAIPGVAKKDADKILDTYMVASDKIAAGPEKIDIKEQGDDKEE